MPKRASFSWGRTPASSFWAPKSVRCWDHRSFAPAKYFKNGDLNIARWDGQNWFALRSGVNGTVRALAVVGTNLYAGGSFLASGSLTVNDVARWGGGNWSSLGSGVSNRVPALALNGGSLSAGSGLNDRVFALAVVDRDVHAGVWFTQAGGRQSFHFGIWPEPVIPALAIAFNSQHSTINVSWPATSTDWTLQQNPNNVSSIHWSNVAAGVQDDGTTKTLLVNPPTGNRYYRLHKP